MRAIAITAPRCAELLQQPDPTGLPGPGKVRGRTLVSLVSPGTELNHFYLAEQGFPLFPGYACVFEVNEVGQNVTALKAGDLVFGSGRHCDLQEIDQAEVIVLPRNLAPEQAVFARLLGVTMSTLNTTSARPPARVLITGLGLIGNLAAQIFQHCGYQVTATDPVERQRNLAMALGICDIRPSVYDAPEIVDKVRLQVECSGHEQAVLDGLSVAGKGGEIVLTGVPWSRRTDIYAQQLLHAVFHRYVEIRSGWEWSVPLQPTEFAGNSIIENYAAGLRWIAEGRIKLEGMAAGFAPEQANEAYRGLLDKTIIAPSVLFDWRAS